MEKHVDFENSIFILNVRLRMIQDIIILNADPGLFLPKTLEDIAFIDASFASLFERLKNNERFLERDEQFYNLAESERILCELLSELCRQDGEFSSALDQEMIITLLELKNRSLERRKVIDELTVNTHAARVDPVVGYEELQELLSG
jgi:hypothetical protein